MNETGSVYVASRASVPERPEMWRRLRAEGWPIISSWIDEAGPGETASLRDLWTRIHAEIFASSMLIMYVEPSDLPLKGAYVEVGMALAMGKPVLVVANFELGSWTRHPMIRVQGDLPSLQQVMGLAQRAAKLPLGYELRCL